MQTLLDCSLSTSTLKRRPHPDTVKYIIIQAIVIEQGFQTDILPVGLIGMNARLILRYIRRRPFASTAGQREGTMLRTP
ncbi:hypothetical protein BDR07DRAFT_1333701, partial [Suillus spraguei]